MEKRNMQLHISVRNLVEFIFRSGDIDNRVGKTANTDAMMEGTRIHKKIQNSMEVSILLERTENHLTDLNSLEKPYLTLNLNSVI